MAKVNKIQIKDKHIHTVIVAKVSSAMPLD